MERDCTLVMFSECLTQLMQRCRGSLFDTRLEKGEGKTKRGMEKNSGQRDEGKGSVVERLGDSGQEQNTVQVNG